VLVFPDVLGYIERNFRHNRRYAEVGAAMRESAAAYLLDVRAGDFPTMANTSAMPAEAFAQFEAEILEKLG